MKRLATIGAFGALALIAAVLVMNGLFSPVERQKRAFDNRLGSVETPELEVGTVQDDPQFDSWQRAIASQPRLWEPLVRAQAQYAPPPNLAQILSGVVPTRNEIGTGKDRKVQIQVDGSLDWYTAGQEIKGCTIKEITDTAVLFSKTQDGTVYGIPLPRR